MVDYACFVYFLFSFSEYIAIIDICTICENWTNSVFQIGKFVKLLLLWIHCATCSNDTFIILYGFYHYHENSIWYICSNVNYNFPWELGIETAACVK